MEREWWNPLYPPSLTQAARQTFRCLSPSDCVGEACSVQKRQNSPVHQLTYCSSDCCAKCFHFFRVVFAGSGPRTCSWKSHGRCTHPAPVNRWYIVTNTEQLDSNCATGFSIASPEATNSFKLDSASQLLILQACHMLSVLEPKHLRWHKRSRSRFVSSLSPFLGIWYRKCSSDYFMISSRWFS